MAKMRVEVNRAAIRALLKSSEVQRDLRRRAEAIAATSPDYEVRSEVGPNRARASVGVREGDYRAMVREARDHMLLSRLDAGRG